MKIDSKDSSNIMNQTKRDKSMDIKETKERLKQEKLQKEREKKEREKQEKERKEREKKEKKEREKALKKGGIPLTSNKQVTSSSTTSALNKITKQNSDSSSELGTPNLPNSKSENVLSKFKNSNSQTATNTSNQSPQLPKGRYRYQIVYLDETVKTFDVDKNALGEDLMTLVCQDLELIEKEYFSLTYRDANNMKFWLDHDKKIKDQLKGNVSTAEPVFNFEVKFYPPEPNVLQEEITRYLLTLQLRHDIMDGKLPCTFVTHALLGSYTVQAELGDYDELTNTSNRLNVNGIAGFDYLEGFCFAPNQTPELLAAIANCHKDNKGQAPAEAEMHYLENAVKLAMYGVDLHNAKDSDGVDILVGISASGLLVFRDHLRINRFAWPKILKISYKRNHFYLKLRPSEFEKYETTIGFRCPNHKAAKRLWKIAVEHHAFFRLREPEKPQKSRILPNFNSNFRYTGSSTYMQSRHRSIERSQPPFARSLSKRLTQSMDRGLANQNPNETPGSVQSAAVNHFNRVKPHMSTSNIVDPYNQLREEEDLEDLEQAGDYNVNDNSLRLNKPTSSNSANQFQATPSRQPAQNSYTQGTVNIPKVNPASFMNRFPKDSANLSNRSNDPNNMYQSVNKKSNFNPNRNAETLPAQNEPFENLDEYYTSVDPNTSMSIKQEMADSALSGSNKSSTPILNNYQQQQQRYVPARQLNINNQRPPASQVQEAEIDENGNLIEPFSVTPRSANNQDSEPLPYTKSPVYKPTSDPKFQTGSNRSVTSSDRVIPQQQTASSFRTGLEQQQQQSLPPRSQLPQPLSRNVKPTPPIPADRTSVSSRDRLNPQQDIENQMLASQQEFENQKILHEKSMQMLRQQQQGIRQLSSTAISREFKTNETSKSGSNISTPDASRSKKQIEKEINHKDLLLRAIEMATELDPSLQVEKVEITTED